MRRTTITLLTVLAVASIAVVAVWASSPHYKSGPKVVDNGLTATATGTIAGLGNGDVSVTLSFPYATSTTTCHNPSPKGKDAPGQNPANPTPVTGTIVAPPNPKNGSLSFTVTTAAPTPPSSGDAGCPSSQWTVTIDSVTFGNGTLVIRQDVDGDGVFEALVLSTNVTVPFP